LNNFAIALNKVQWGGRVTALAVHEDDGRVLVHVGMGTLYGGTRRLTGPPAPGAGNGSFVSTRWNV
jgi:hypothetical protein